MMRTLHRRRAGFTLAEVLISLGVFAIGMIAVASLFPVAAILQKETANDILGAQSTTNARATLEAVGLTYRPATAAVTDGDLDDYYTLWGLNTRVVRPVGTPFPSGFDGTSFFNRYNLAERSFPTTEADVQARDHYWFFFARDSAGNAASPSWQGFVLVVEREQGQDYNDLVAGMVFGEPTENVPYITLDGKTGVWNIANPPTILVPASGDVYFHPQGIGVETFVFETLP